MRKWKICDNFKGVWYSPCYGGFRPDNRLSTKRPKDTMYDGKDSLRSKPHQFAKPTFITRKEIEEDFGIIETVIYVEPEKRWGQSYLDILIFTTKYIVSIDEYGGNEWLHNTPRNPEVYLLEKEEE